MGISQTELSDVLVMLGSSENSMNSYVIKIKNSAELKQVLSAAGVENIQRRNDYLSIGSFKNTNTNVAIVDIEKFTKEKANNPTEQMLLSLSDEVHGQPIWIMYLGSDGIRPASLGNHDKESGRQSAIGHRDQEFRTGDGEQNLILLASRALGYLITTFKNRHPNKFSRLAIVMHEGTYNWLLQTDFGSPLIVKHGTVYSEALMLRKALDVLNAIKNFISVANEEKWV